MLVVMEHGATPEQVQKVVRVIEEMGYEARPMPGKQRTAVSLVGNDGKVNADRLESPCGPVEIARDPADGTVHALRGAGFAGMQFHPESVLSRDGVAVLAQLLPALTASTVSPATNG